MNVWLQLASTMLVGVLTAGGALLGVRRVAAQAGGGLHLMSALAESDLAGPDELKLMEILADRVLNPLLDELKRQEVSGDD